MSYVYMVHVPNQKHLYGKVVKIVRECAVSTGHAIHFGEGFEIPSGDYVVKRVQHIVGNISLEIEEDAGWETREFDSPTLLYIERL